MARLLTLCLLVLLASSPLMAGVMGGSDEYLVIVNESSSELVVSYRAGVFTGPDLQQVIMLMQPMQSPGKKYTKIRKYWPITEAHVQFQKGVLTFSISPDTAVMVGGVWLAAGVEEGGTISPHLEIDGPGKKTEYDGIDVFAAFDRLSRGLRMLVVE